MWITLSEHPYGGEGRILEGEQGGPRTRQRIVRLFLDEASARAHVRACAHEDLDVQAVEIFPELPTLPPAPAQGAYPNGVIEVYIPATSPTHYNYSFYALPEGVDGGAVLAAAKRALNIPTRCPDCSADGAEIHSGCRFAIWHTAKGDEKPDADWLRRAAGEPDTPPTVQPLSDLLHRIATAENARKPPFGHVAPTAPRPQLRDLSTVNTAAITASANDVIVRGDPDSWQLVWKVSSKQNGSMFSIKRHHKHGLYQFTWVRHVDLCEAVVYTGGCMMKKREGKPDFHVVVASDLVESHPDHYYHVAECAAESKSLGFRKSTLVFELVPASASRLSGDTILTMTETHGPIVLVMTEDRGKIGMSAAVTSDTSSVWL